MLKPFRIRDLRDAPTSAAGNNPDSSCTRDGVVQISGPDYDSTCLKHPDAVLMYMDDDDGETITVSSAFELGQRLDEPVNLRPRRASRYLLGRNILSYPSPLDSTMHIFDIKRSDTNLDLWRGYEIEPANLLSNGLRELGEESNSASQADSAVKVYAVNVDDAMSSRELNDERQRWFWACNPPRVVPVQAPALNANEPTKIPISTSTKRPTRNESSSSLTSEGAKQARDAAAKFRRWKNPASIDMQESSPYKNRWASYQEDPPFTVADARILSTNPGDKFLNSKTWNEPRPVPKLPATHVPLPKPTSTNASESTARPQSSALPRNEREGFLEAFEAEMAKIMSSASEPESGPERKAESESVGDASSTSQAQQSPLPINAGEMFVNTLQSLAQGVSQLGTEMSKAFPNNDQDMSSAQRQSTGQVDRAVRGALVGLGNQMDTLANCMQTASGATHHAAEKTREADSRAVEGAVKGLLGVFEGIGIVGKTVFSAFETEFGPKPKSPDCSSTQEPLREKNTAHEDQAPVPPPKHRFSSSAGLPQPVRPFEFGPSAHSRSRSPIAEERYSDTGRSGRSRSPPSHGRTRPFDPLRRGHGWTPGRHGGFFDHGWQGHPFPPHYWRSHPRHGGYNPFHRYPPPPPRPRPPPPPPMNSITSSPYEQPRHVPGPHEAPTMPQGPPVAPALPPPPFVPPGLHQDHASIRHRQPWYPDFKPEWVANETVPESSIKFSTPCGPKDPAADTTRLKSNGARRVRSVGSLCARVEDDIEEQNESLEGNGLGAESESKKPIPGAILDQDLADPSFSVRYPSLMANRGPHLPNTLRSPVANFRPILNPTMMRSMSPESQMVRFPTLSQFEEQAYKEHAKSQSPKNPESSGPREKPEPRPQQDQVQPNLSGAFFEKNTGLRVAWDNDDEAAPLKAQLSRSKTVTASNPAARLAGPFDPLSTSFATSHAEDTLQRRATDRMSRRRRFDGDRRPYSEHFSGDGRMGWESFLRQYEKKTPGSFPTRDDSATVVEGPRPQPPRPSLRIDTGRHARARPREKTKNEQCLETLKMLGFGSKEDGGDERLVIYAEAAEGNLEDAIEMIEEERKAYKERAGT